MLLPSESSLTDALPFPLLIQSLRDAFAAGCLTNEDIRGDLASLARGQDAGRTSLEQRTVFKAVGTALEDLAAAKLAFRHLRDAT